MPPKAEADTIEIKNLEKLIKALKVRPPTIKIGILGSGARHGKAGASSSSVATNATVGAVHEYGAPGRNIPQRSFLRVPLADNLDKYLEKDGAFDNEVLEDVVRQGTILPWMNLVAGEAMAVVMDAFETSGFGKWPAWKDPNYSNGGNQLLVDTEQLRDSIRTEVKP